MNKKSTTMEFSKEYLEIGLGAVAMCAVMASEKVGKDKVDAAFSIKFGGKNLIVTVKEEVE